MSPRLARSIPVVIAGLVFLATCLVSWVVQRFGPDTDPSDLSKPGWTRRVFRETAGFLHRLELFTRDERVAKAAQTSTAASNLGLVVLTSKDLQAIQDADGSFFPQLRHVYAALIEELAAQGAAGVVLDVFLLQPQPGVADPTAPKGQVRSSDDRLSRALDAARPMPVTLIGLHDATSGNIHFPHTSFATNATAVGHATWMRDVDTVIRRAEAFVQTQFFQPADVRSFPRLAARLKRQNDPISSLLMSNAPVELKGALALEVTDSAVPAGLDSALMELLDAVAGGPLIYTADRFKDVSMRARTRQLVEDDSQKVPNPILNRMLLEDALAEELIPNPLLPGHETGWGRMWHAGIHLAAGTAGLDMDGAHGEPGRIILPRKAGVAGAPIIVPTDEFGEMWIDWALPTGSGKMQIASVSDLLQAHASRLAGATVQPTWTNRLVVVATDVPGARDRGSTPLGREEMEASGIWNIANMILTERFPRMVGWDGELLLITLLTGLSAVLSWRLRAIWATPLVIGVAAGYVSLAFRVYDQSRVMLPIVLPVAGSLVMTHVAMVSCRLVSEWIEGIPVRGAWRRVLSKNVFKELERTAFQVTGGRRKQGTVVFADLRGFVTVLGKIRQESRSGSTDSLSSATAALGANTEQDGTDHALMVVNGYLTAIATTFRDHNGTLDKFIGDCVMAFWGAPVASDRHAALAVEAAIKAQRRVQEINRRAAPLDARDPDWWRTASETSGPPLSEPLRFGIGINTGLLVAGFVGSTDTISSYTVLGPEVNLASRLEGAAEGEEILISESTFAELERTAPDLARRCERRGPYSLQGLAEPVPVYAVRWRDDIVDETL